MIKLVQEKQDVDKLNYLLANTPSPSAKLVIMSYLEEFKSETSIPILIKTLSFDLPWWDKFDSELRPTPCDVRFSAYEVLGVYGESILNELKKLVQKNKSYEQLYAAALLYKIGYSENKAVLQRYQSIGGKFKEDVSLLTHELAI